MAKIYDGDLDKKWYFVSLRDVDWTHKDNLNFERTYALMDGMIYALSIMVWGKTRKTVRYPKTWVDAVKLRWFPRWAREKWPAIIVTVRYDEILPMLSTKTKKSTIVQMINEANAEG